MRATLSEPVHAARGGNAASPSRRLAPAKQKQNSVTAPVQSPLPPLSPPGALGMGMARGGAHGPPHGRVQRQGTQGPSGCSGTLRTRPVPRASLQKPLGCTQRLRWQQRMRFQPRCAGGSARGSAVWDPIHVPWHPAAPPSPVRPGGGRAPAGPQGGSDLPASHCAAFKDST